MANNGLDQGCSDSTNLSFGVLSLSGTFFSSYARPKLTKSKNDPFALGNIDHIQKKNCAYHDMQLLTKGFQVSFCTLKMPRYAHKALRTERRTETANRNEIPDSGIIYE